MSPRMLRLLPLVSLIAGFAPAGEVGARVVSARIAKVTTAVATLDAVQVSLEWPAQAAQGQLRLRAKEVRAPDLGYRFRSLDWRCPLQRDGKGGWRCDGEVRGGGGAPFRLSLDLGMANTEARLVRGASQVALHRNAATPDITRIDLTSVPLAWTQALLAQSWKDARITGGTLDASLTVTATTGQPLQIAGPLRLASAAFDTPDGTIAAENLGAQVSLDMRLGDSDRVVADGRLLGGELLFGTTYVSLQQRPVALHIDANQVGQAGWRFPRLAWRDAGVLEVEGSGALGSDFGVRDLDLRLGSRDLGPLRDGYLTGWLGLAGLGDLQLAGAADVLLRVHGGQVDAATVRLRDVAIDDPQGRFDFDGLDGDVRFSSGKAVASEMRVRGGALYGLDFGSTRLPFESSGGELRLSQAATLPILGGNAHFDDVSIRLPTDGQGLDVRFGLTLDQLDVARLATALDWPAFTGELSGRIPQARYANNRLDFDGGLEMQVFSGRVSVSELSMERPFGVAPTLSADVGFDDLDLESLTSVFGFGSITGRLDGRIGGLRLVDWQPVAFDAELHTDRKRGVRQRISQRAVQNISSVGDASFVGSLQGQLIGLFDDFGYKRIGIACKLSDEVCTMDGLGSAGQGFIIVEGAGIPRLSVIGFNRRVDWPTLLERLEAVGTGEVKPVVD